MLKKVIAIREKSGYNKLIHYPYYYEVNAQCIRFWMVRNEVMLCT